jgi:hypothetical protein
MTFAIVELLHIRLLVRVKILPWMMVYRDLPRFG